MDASLAQVILTLVVFNAVFCLLILASFKKSSDKLAKLSLEMTSLQSSQSSVSTEASAGSSQALLDAIKKYDSHFSLIASTLTAFQESADKGLKRVDREMTRIESLVVGMRDYLSESNEQTTRLQEGYDYAVLKKFVRPVIQVIHGLESLEARLSKLPEGDEIRAHWTELLDLLEHSGIERFDVEVGSSFSDMRKEAEAVTQKEQTTDPDKVGKVAEVIRSGYRYVYNNDRKRLVLPAQVKLYEKVEG
ncbi:MAG: nucleotide exchange factor GrpE [Kiritimatiellaceae bacterium]|nr:nucleotide exchange factor GrpE [Kiritimatiellaceae bacterium]